MLIILGSILLVFGFVSYKFPSYLWRVENVRKENNSEPAEWYLLLSKYGGLLMMFSGGLLLISYFIL